MQIKRQLKRMVTVMYYITLSKGVKKFLFCSLCENRRSVGQNRQSSEMSRKFCHFADSMYDKKINLEKCPNCVWVTWPSINEYCTYFLHAYFLSSLQQLLNLERPVFKQSRVLLVLSSSFQQYFLDCQTAVR